jgi:monovalent cation:H+ antiporter, CPA1 family
VSFETLFLVLFAIASAVALLAHRVKIPYTVALVATGLVLGVIHLIEPPHLTRQLLYSFILPGLLFEASFHLEFADFWKNRLAIPMLAVPGVLASILLTAAILTAIAHALVFMRGFTLTEGLVFGAVIAATDPIAVVALFRTTGAPRRLRILVEGESLLNDGTAVVLFGLVLGYVSGAHVTAGSLVLEFFKIVGTGALTGLALGSVVTKVISSVEDPMIEITLTTIAAYGSFVAAEAIGGSGVIATVSAGMLCGNYAGRGMSPSSRIAVGTFWEYVAFALNSIIFLLIGFELRARDLVASWQPILAAYLSVTLGRGIVILGVSSLLRSTRERIPWSWTTVLTWSGLRGALSMVLALSLAIDFPQRQLLITMTFGVVLISILIQGTARASLLKRLGLVGSPSEAHLQAQETRASRRRLLLTEKSSLFGLVRRGVLDGEASSRVIADIDAKLLELGEPRTEETLRNGNGSADDEGSRGTSVPTDKEHTR